MEGILNKNSKVLVATFSPWEKGVRSPTNGMVEPFIDFFSKRVGHFVLLDQPHPGSDILLPRIEIYKGKKLTTVTKNSFFVKFLYPLLFLTNKHQTQITFKLRDFFSVLDFVLTNKTKYDLFIGFESVNALAGALLRKMGRIERVVYYVSDFSPKRYKQKWFNAIYLYLDKLATTYSNATWNVSHAMSKARKKLGYNMEKMSQQLYAPNAFFKHEIKYNPLSKVNRYGIVYAGTMGPENGPDLAIKAMPLILKEIPQAKLTLIGGGGKEQEMKLKKLIQRLGLKNNVEYRGFIPTNKEMYQIIRSNAVSIAPYRAMPNSVRWYADAVKIRTSLACGLPVVTTQVPPNGRLVEDTGAGVVTRDNSKDLAGALIKIFSNRKGYLKMRKNAIAAARENTWENSFSNALKDMGIK